MPHTTQLAWDEPGLVVTYGTIQAITERTCAGCGLHLPRGSYLDNITGEAWCSGCGDARNGPASLAHVNAVAYMAKRHLCQICRYTYPYEEMASTAVCATCWANKPGRQETQS